MIVGQDDHWWTREAHGSDAIFASGRELCARRPIQVTAPSAWRHDRNDSVAGAQPGHGGLPIPTLVATRNPLGFRADVVPGVHDE